MGRPTGGLFDDALMDELCHTITVERGDGADVYHDARYLLRRNTGLGSLVGVEVGGERAVWQFELAGEPKATIAEFQTAMRPIDREKETLARGDEVAGALQEVEYAWVHPEYRGIVSTE